MQPATGSVIGNVSDPNAATTDQFKVFWKELASRFENNTNVMCVERAKRSVGVTEGSAKRSLALGSTMNHTSWLPPVKLLYSLLTRLLSMPTSLVLANDQAAIDGIRESGAKQLILAPGNGYTGKSRQSTRWSGDHRLRWL